MYKVDNKDTKATSFDVFLVSLLLTLNTKTYAITKNLRSAEHNDTFYT